MQIKIRSYTGYIIKIRPLPTDDTADIIFGKGSYFYGVPCKHCYVITSIMMGDGVWQNKFSIKKMLIMKNKESFKKKYAYTLSY